MKAASLLWPLAFWLGACGTSPSPAASPVVTASLDGLRPDTQPPLPRNIPGYVVQDTMAFEEANSGVEYRYARDDGFQADVYLYPLPPQGYLCTDRCAVGAAVAITEEFKEAFPAFVERGYADSMVAEREVDVPVPAQSWLHRGRHLTLRMVRKGKPLHSHFIAFVGREAILKLRISYAAGAFPPSTVDSFVTALLPRVPPPFSCGAGTSTEAGVTLSTTQARQPDDFVRALDSVLQVPPSRLDYRDPGGGAWRSVPHFESLSRDDSTPSPGVIVFARVTARGDSSTAFITTQDACRLTSGRNAKTPSVARMILGLLTMAMMDSAMQLNGAPGME